MADRSTIPEKEKNQIFKPKVKDAKSKKALGLDIHPVLSLKLNRENAGNLTTIFVTRLEEFLKNGLIQGLLD